MRIIPGHEPVQPGLEVAPRRGIGVFHHDEAATRVRAKDGEHAVAQAALAQDGRALVSDLMGARAVRRKVESGGVNRHRLMGQFQA